MDAANQNVTDDQELAKVLESMNQQGAASTPSEPVTTSDGLAFEETPAAGPVDDTTPPVSDPEPTEEAAPVDEPVVEPIVEPVVEPTTDRPDDSTAGFADLDALKKNALEELRPLVGKLDLPADEKFDTLLLLIRSTDDKSLLEAAHDAAKNIANETKRAQALLDIIKEIDYFSGHGQAPQ
jgi:hypothetical protein